VALTRGASDQKMLIWGVLSECSPQRSPGERTNGLIQPEGEARRVEVVIGGVPYV